jgi:ASC-1-like (ASCH) protein
MISAEWIKNVLPDYENIKKWIEEVYYKFYSPELEKHHWVVSIKLKVI